MSGHRFWLAWVTANALGEMLGLGTVFVIGVLLAPTVGKPAGLVAYILLAVLVVALAVLEGAVVGYAQWVVLRRAFGALSAPRWVAATVIGAVVAWVLGMIPSTIASASSAAGQSSASPQPSHVTILLAAAGMGLVLGFVLASAQWWVLRRHVRKALWWLPANGLAWAAAMPLIFWLVGGTIAEQQSIEAIVLLVGGIALAGAVVGAVHGAFLIWLLIPNRVAA